MPNGEQPLVVQFNFFIVPEQGLLDLVQGGLLRPIAKGLGHGAACGIHQRRYSLLRDSADLLTYLIYYRVNNGEKKKKEEEEEVVEDKKYKRSPLTSPGF